MIFLHRQGSLQPFSRNFPSHEVMDLLQLKDLPGGSCQIEGGSLYEVYIEYALAPEHILQLL